MRYGKLDRQVTVLRKVPGQDDYGGELDTWSILLRRRSADVAPLGAEERFTDPQLAAHDQIAFTLRWSPQVSAITPKDRIIYPALHSGEVPDDTIENARIYDIVSSLEDGGRKDSWRIVAVRRADT